MNSILSLCFFVHDCYRQRDHEGRSKPGSGTLRSDGPSVTLNQLFHNCEAEAKATMMPCSGAVRLSKAIKDMRQEFRRDSLAGVDNRDLDMRINPL